jgi:hypothetical protein
MMNKKSQDKVAEFIRKLDGFQGEAALYRMEPSLEGHRYVVVSATTAPFTGPETFLFPATKAGKVKDWGELDGSIRGTLEHKKALKHAGYRLGV